MFFSDKTSDGVANVARRRVFRAVALLTTLAMVWLSGPHTALASITFERLHPKPKPYTLLKPGLTQTPDANLLEKITARQEAENNKPRPEFRPLTKAEKRGVTGRGPKRQKYFAGAPMPWHRAFRDINLCTGNLFKSFTDIQIAPARGAGLVLQRTYNSNDEREGPFGVGWTHAYDIRMDETGTVDANGDDIVDRTDFFGRKHSYKRDADGLYSPPPYLYDEMSSQYKTALIQGIPTSLTDIDKGMDGTIKHYITGGTKPDGTESFTRVCDYIKDRHNNTTTLTYGLTVTMPDNSTQKLLTKVTDPSNRSLNFTWANVGTTAAPHWRITQVQGSDTNSNSTYKVTYDYDANFQLWKVHLDSDGLNRTTTYAYTSFGGESNLLASITDPLGHTISYGYATALPHNDGGIGGIYGDGTTPVNAPTDTVWVSQVTEPAGEDASHVARSLTWKVYVCYSNGFTGFYTDVQPTDSSLAVVVPNVTVDSSLRVLSVGGYTVPRIAVYGYEYDPINNNILTSYQLTIEPAAYFPGSPTQWSPSGGTIETKYTYGSFGNVISQTVTGFNGSTITDYYDASKYFQKKSVTDPLGHTTSFDYFGVNDSDVTVGNKGELRWARDAGYNVSGSPSYQKQYAYTYNNYGQKLTETNPNGVVQQFLYDSSDVWGNLTRAYQDYGSGKLNRGNTWTYDIYGRIVQTTDSKSQKVTFQYNALGQPSQAKFYKPGGSVVEETVDYTYGDNGRTESVNDARGLTTIQYETGCDRVASVTDPVTGAVAYTYGKLGERRTTTLPNGDLYQYQYQETFTPRGFYPPVLFLPKDDVNSVGFLPKKIIAPGNRVMELGIAMNGMPRWMRYNMTFDGQGNRTSFNEVRYTPEYSTQTGQTDKLRGGIASVSTQWWNLTGSTWNSKPIAQNDYVYNDAGQRTQNQITQLLTGQATPTVRTEAYGYDELNRLKTVDYGDGETQTYGFDAMGNRTSKTDTISGSGTVSETYQYDAINRLYQRDVGSTNYTYTNDNTGNTGKRINNTTAVTERANTWDSQNRLISCVTGSGATQKTSTFTYGIDGLRRSMTVQTGNVASTAQFVETSYVLDNQNVIQEKVRQKVGSGGTWSQPVTYNYIMGPQGPLARITDVAADARWYVYDGLGSVLTESFVDGTVTGSRKYDVYGGTRSYTGTPLSRQAFVGQLGHATDDETSLTYMRARYYDSSIGRFINEDRAQHGMNWFAYCGNDPVNRIDPTGKEDWIVTALLAILGGILGNEAHDYYKRYGRLALGKYLEKRADLMIRTGEAQEAFAAYLTRISQLEGALGNSLGEMMYGWEAREMGQLGARNIAKGVALMALARFLIGTGDDG